MVFWMGLYSCLLFSMCTAYNDLGMLILCYLLCLENLALRDICLTYACFITSQVC